MTDYFFGSSLCVKMGIHPFRVEGGWLAVGLRASTKRMPNAGDVLLFLRHTHAYAACALSVPHEHMFVCVRVHFSRTCHTGLTDRVGVGAPERAVMVDELW